MKNTLTMLVLVFSWNIYASGLDVNAPNRERVEAIVKYQSKNSNADLSKITNAILDEKKMGMDLINYLCESKYVNNQYWCYEYFARVKQVDTSECKKPEAFFNSEKTVASFEKATLCLKPKLAASIVKLPVLEDHSSKSSDCSGMVDTTTRSGKKPGAIEGVLKKETSNTNSTSK